MSLSKQALKRTALCRRQAASFGTRALATTLVGNGGSQTTNGAAIAGVAAALAAAVGVSQHRESKTDCFGVTTATTTESPTTDTHNHRLFFHNFGLRSSPFHDMKKKSTNTTSITSNTTTATLPIKKDSIDLVSSRHLTGIAHTRWANNSHGRLENDSHYYVDASSKIAVLHNGSLDNSKQLKRELRQKGHVFTRQTDGEVVCKLIKHYRETQPHLSLQEATEKALSRCQGQWGSLCILNEDSPDELVVACNGAPLVLGMDQHGRTFISTQHKPAAPSQVMLRDGEMGIVRADDQTLEMTKSLFDDKQVKLSPGLYQHWTLKELSEQPQAMARALGYGGRLSNDRVLLGGLDKESDKVSQIKRMQLQGSGTSLFAAQYGELLMKMLGSFASVETKDASCSTSTDFSSADGVICVDTSGQDEDVYRVANQAKQQGVTVMSVVNAVGSLLARTTQLGVYCNAGRENSQTSTKAFASQVTVLALMALWFRQSRDAMEGLVTPSEETMRLKEALMRLPITFGMTLTTRNQCKEVAASLNNCKQVTILGKGYGEPVAKEGALKMMEIGNLAATSNGALKRNTSVVALVLDDEHCQEVLEAALEAKARGADVTIITDKQDLMCEDCPTILIPSNGPMTALGAILPLQLIAYEVAMQKGINPDLPRGL